MTDIVSTWCQGCVGACASTRSYCPFTSAGRVRLAVSYTQKRASCPYWKPAGAAASATPLRFLARA